MKFRLPRQPHLKSNLSTIGFLYLVVAGLVLSIFLVRYFDNQSELLTDNVDMVRTQK